MDLNRLTIVIPTNGRPHAIRRAVDYWHKTPVQLVILDGAEQPIKIPEKYLAGGNVTYHHAPGTLMERMGKSTDFVKTEYAALISDDEFFLLSALHNCIRFLDDHEEYVACKGLAVAFGWDGRIINWRPTNKTLRGYEVAAESPAGRMYEHFSNYAHASLWSVQRRDVYVASMKAVGSGPPFSAGPCFEVQVALITSYMGKIKVLDELMWLRSDENESIAWKEMPLSFRDWWRDKSLRDEHSRLINSVITYANEYYSPGPSYLEVQAALEAQVQGSEERLRLGVQKRKEKRRRWLFNFYVVVNKYGKIFLNKTIFYGNGYSGYSLLSHIRKAYPAKYEEIKEIADLIYEHHKGTYLRRESWL